MRRRPNVKLGLKRTGAHAKAYENDEARPVSGAACCLGTEPDARLDHAGYVPAERAAQHRI